MRDLNWRKKAGENGSPKYIAYWHRIHTACCDCGLVHLDLYEPWTKRGKVVGLRVTTFRDDYETTRNRNLRRKLKKK